MKAFILAIALAILFAFLPSTSYAADGMKCLICVAVVDLAAKAVVDRKEDLGQVLSQGCLKIFPEGTTRDICERIISDLAPEIIDLVVSKELPDKICGKLNLCDKCQLFPPELAATKSAVEVEDKQYRGRYLSTVLDFQLKSLGFSKGKENSSKYRPGRLADVDGDGFSWTHSLGRGADWRGRDCNDVSGASHPGVKEGGSIFFDKNCNGIYGKTHTISGENYEDIYCNSYPHDRQLISFGDSALAGFTIPVAWLEFKNLGDVVHTIIDELDFPMKSYSTGYEASDSFVNYLYNHNRCSHRQFQNIGMNGAVMADLVQQVGEAVISNDSKPVFASIAYIGNDICHDKLEDMTKPEDFRAQLIAGLEKLDSVVPSNSRVLVLGLVDGSVIYENVANQSHPLSIHAGDIKVSDFYRFLSCTGANPCQTWLNSDKATRDAATAHAKNLDNIIQDVLTTRKFKNFETAFVNFTDIIACGFAIMDSKGIPRYKMMDPVDNFHPSLEVGQRLIAQCSWNILQSKYPGFIGEPNPNNAAIQKVFGSQGGF